MTDSPSNSKMMQPGGPGWNDPPKLSHKVHTETKVRRNALNKRVAYLDAQKCTNEVGKVALTADMPPPINRSFGSDPVVNVLKQITSPTPKLHLFIPNTSHESQSSASNNATVNEVNDSNLTVAEIDIDLENLDVVSELLNLTKERLNEKNKNAAADIYKRLDILKSALDAGELSQETEIKMKDLTKKLMLKRYQQAWDIHVSLMCDHISEVRSWMVGIKRLIGELKKG